MIKRYIVEVRGFWDDVCNIGFVCYIVDSERVFVVIVVDVFFVVVFVGVVVDNVLSLENRLVG